MIVLWTPQIKALDDRFHAATVFDDVISLSQFHRISARLINLYANLGNADPLIVACALDGREQDSRLLFAPEWVVVTGDVAVREKAEGFGLRVLSNSSFAQLIDEAIGEPQ